MHGDDRAPRGGKGGWARSAPEYIFPLVTVHISFVCFFPLSYLLLVGKGRGGTNYDVGVVTVGFRGGAPACDDIRGEKACKKLRYH